MLKWLASIFASSLTFALADILCDVCISEKEVDEPRGVETAEDDEGEALAAGGSERGSDTANVDELSDIDPSDRPASFKLASALAGVFSQSPLYRQLSNSNAAQPSKAVAPCTCTPPSQSRSPVSPRVRAGASTAKPLPPSEDVGLTGEQDTAIAGMVTVVGLVVTVLYWVISGATEWRTSLEPGLFGLKGLPRLQWGPLTHLQFWLAMLGGSMAFLHYYFLLKAFEGAPSTVLLPLVQVASVSVLFGSSIVAFLRNEQWITPVHTLAYVLMFIGGILPACGGQLSALLQRSFWRQTFVYFAILAEFALGLHDLMLSGCSYHSDRPADPPTAVHGAPLAEEEVVESFEFFVWSRCSFIATFVSMYTLSPQLHNQLRDLFSGRIPSRYIWLSALSEALTVLGFYLASIAYGLFYQAGIVHAAEASLSQLLNLLLAYLLLKCFGIGRDSAVGSMSAKVVSFVMVSVGLFLCTLEESAPVVKKTVAAGPLLEMGSFVSPALNTTSLLRAAATRA